MIYFQFQISPLSANPTPRDDIRSADFFFNSTDPAASTHRAVSILGQCGWRPTGVIEAQEAYSFRDFEADVSLEPFFDDAEREGMAFRVNVHDHEHAVANHLSLHTDLGEELAELVSEFPLPEA